MDFAINVPNPYHGIPYFTPCEHSAYIIQYQDHDRKNCQNSRPLSEKFIRSITQNHYLMLNIGYVFPRQEHHRDVKWTGLTRNQHGPPEPDP